VVSFTPRPLYPQGKSSWYTLDGRLGWPQNRSGRGGEEKNSQPPPGIEPRYTDLELSRLSSPTADLSLLALALTVVALWHTLSADSCGHGIEPCVESW
jgi:hypothetical protein